MQANGVVNIVINNCIRNAGNGMTLGDSGHELFEDLIRRGYRVNLAALVVDNYATHGMPLLPDSISIIQLNLYRRHSGIIPRIVNYVVAVARLASFCRRRGAFYLYIPSNIPIIAILFLRLFCRPYGVYVRGVFKHSIMLNRMRHSRLLNKLYECAIRKASFVLATGLQIRDECLCINTNTSQVSQMLSVTEFDLVNDKYICPIATRLLYVGRLSWEKGIQSLIEACQILHQNSVEFQLRLVGDGDEQYVQRIATLIHEAGLKKNIQCVGRISDRAVLKAEYAAADVFVFPSLYEGFPRVIYEAMTYGLPVVASDLDEFRGTLIDGQNSILFPVKNTSVLSKILIAVMKSPETRKSLSASAVECMKRYFSEVGNRTHAEQLLDCIASCTQNVNS